MTLPRSFQDWVHWLELGSGARLIRRTAFAVGLAILSFWICYKQFHGPRTETTLRQAVVGRQLTDGHGFTTLVNDPQTAAFVAARNGRWNTQPFPELHQAPLYPALIGAVFQLVPESIRNYFFQTAPTPPDGFIPDYILLGLNVVLFWIAAAQTYFLSRALFDRRVGVVSAVALLLSAPYWDSVVAVNGTALATVIVLGLIQAVIRVEAASSRGILPLAGLLITGLFCGGLFLTDYAAGLSVLVLLGYVWVRFPGERFRAILVLVLGFLVVISPWCTFLLAHTDNPVGFAWQEIAMKVDGTAADPAVVRATLSVAGPGLDLAKLGNKALTAIQSAITQNMWAGGGLWFTGLFVAGLFYRFREERVNALRALIVALFVVLILGNALFDSGEGERLPTTYAAPLLVIFGAGFAAVLISSSEKLDTHALWAFSALLALQALPLAKALLEPRKLHFQYPPYYPTLFISMREEMWARSGGTTRGWMADVPAGAAWYSGQRVWTMPAELRDFYAIGAEQPMVALVLTPKTLDKPFLSELAHHSPNESDRVGDWSQIFKSLVTGKPVPGFPLALRQNLADNFCVLIDPQAVPNRRR